MSDRNIARIRTALPQAWGAVAVFRTALSSSDLADIASYFGV